MKRSAAFLTLIALAIASVGLGVVNQRLREVDIPGVSGCCSGVSIRFSEDGGIVRVADRGRVLPLSGARGGFSIRPVGGMPNLLPNAGLEDDADGNGVPDGWRVSGGVGAGSLTAGRNGGRAWSVTSGGPVSLALFTDVQVEPGVEYVLRSWIRTDDVSPPGTTVSITPARVQVFQEGVSGRRGAAAAFGYTGDSPWTRHDTGFRTRPGVRRVQVQILIREGQGTARFDDLYLGALLRPPVEVRGLAHEGLGVTGPGFEGEIPSEGVRVGAELFPHEQGLVVAGDLVGLDGADHAARVSFTLPVDLRGWLWGDDPRQSRPIRDGTYANLSDPTPQGGREPHGGISQILRTSVYPFGGASDERTALGLGVPMRTPTAFRISASADGLNVEFDLAVSPNGPLAPGAIEPTPRAGFEFVILRSEGRWGFRGLAEAHYAAYPGEFDGGVSPDRAGAWFAAPPLQSFPAGAHQDFGLGLDMLALGKAPTQSFSEWGRPYLSWTDERGIVASAYTHQWMLFQPRARGGPLPDTYGEVLADLEATASAESRGDPAGVRRREEARAALASTARDANGRYLYETYGGFYGFYQNADGGPAWFGAVKEHQILRALRIARQEGSRLDGIHLDSTSGARRWGAVCDHDRNHWGAARSASLTFSYASGEPCQLGALSMGRHLQRVGALVHGRGMVLSANHNAGPDRALGWIGADVIDVFGLEQGLPEKAVTPDRIDALAMLKRTLAYQRPVTTLDDRIADGSLTLEEIDARIRQSVFYGIFPGAWSRAENEGPTPQATWSTPEIRAVFARYTPVLRDLAAAGWEPVTLARTDDPHVWLERYGEAGQFLTVRNETGRARTFTLRLDDALLRGGELTMATERLSGRSYAISGGTLEATIGPGDTLVLELRG